MVAKVQIHTTVKWAMPWLVNYLEQINNLEYDKGSIRYAFVTTPSEDNSIPVLMDWLKNKPNFYLRNFTPPAEYGAREKMWMSGNFSRKFAITPMKGDWLPDYIFMCDCDVVSIPPHTLKTLVALDVDIVAPYVYVDPENVGNNPVRNKRVFYDTSSYRFLNGQYKGYRHPLSFADWYRDHINDPEVGAVNKLIPMESVGCNPVLVKRKVIEDCWYEGNEAIVGFCNLARARGYKIWSYPDIEVKHSWRSIYSRADV